MGPKPTGTGTGVYRLKRVNSFSFGLYTTVFQTEIYAIKAWGSGEFCSVVFCYALPSFHMKMKVTTTSLIWHRRNFFFHFA